MPASVAFQGDALFYYEENWSRDYTLDNAAHQNHPVLKIKLKYNKRKVISVFSFLFWKDI